MDRFFSALLAGNYVSVAAVFAGLTPAQVYNWVRKGRAEPEGPYGAFAQAHDEYIAHAEVRLITYWANAAEDDWKAARDLAARRFPKRWGKQMTHRVGMALEANVNEQSQVDVHVSSGADLSDLDDLTEEELDQIEAIRERARQRAALNAEDA